MATPRRKKKKARTREVVQAEVVERDEPTKALVSPSVLSRARIVEARQLLELFLRGRSAKTLDNYRFDLVDFAAFLEVDDIQTAVDQFIQLDSATAHALIFSYKAHLREKPICKRGSTDPYKTGYAPATINRRVAALKSLVRLARTVGLISWNLQVPAERSRKVRDTMGCGPEAYAALIAQVELEVTALREDRRRDRETRIAFKRRDLALLRLMYDSALRRKEPLTIDYPDDVRVEQLPKKAKPRILMLGKTRGDKEWITVSQRTAQAIVAWLDCRGRQAGPLFTSSHPSFRDQRLSTKAVNEMLDRLSKRAGLPHVTPHQLRHTSITRALDKTGGDVRKVQRFSRHENITMVMEYDDLRRDVAGDIAELVSEDG